MFVESNGLLIGAILLCLVTVCALLLGRRAAQSVAQFREEHHQRFTGRQDR